MRHQVIMPSKYAHSRGRHRLESRREHPLQGCGRNCRVLPTVSTLRVATARGNNNSIVRSAKPRHRGCRHTNRHLDFPRESLGTEMIMSACRKNTVSIYLRKRGAIFFCFANRRNTVICVMPDHYSTTFRHSNLPNRTQSALTWSHICGDISPTFRS